MDHGGVDCGDPNCGFCYGRSTPRPPIPARDLFSVPPQPPRVVQQTSRDAYEDAKPRIPTLKDRALDALQRHGARTADEVGDLIGETPFSVRPVFTNLRREGKVEDTGQRRRNESGKQAIVWRPLPPERWRDAEDRMTAPERIEKLQARVRYLEMLLTKEGIDFA